MKKFVLAFALAASAVAPLAANAAQATQTSTQTQVTSHGGTCVDWSAGVCDSSR